MRIIRFLDTERLPQLAAVTDEDKIYSLPYADLIEIYNKAKKENKTMVNLIYNVIDQSHPLESSLEDLELLVPIEAQEVWAAGVTYEQSRAGRNHESSNEETSPETFYDKVYEAKRPEIFLKSTKERTVGPEDNVCLRSDSNWQIPEPELGLVISDTGEIIGYIIGNDMSSRDIEGENPLYLPQAKIWKNSCSIGPAIRLAETVKNPYDFEINCRIYRQDLLEFEGQANTSQLKRKLDELVSYLIKDNLIFDGTVLLTGTCIIPPNEFTLKDGDRIEIEIPSIGLLANSVKALK